MRAVHFCYPGGPDVSKIVEETVPNIEENEVLIKVKAAGINRPDIVQREGNYPAPKYSKILGLEVSGIVEKIGKKVKNFNWR